MNYFVNYILPSTLLSGSPPPPSPLILQILGRNWDNSLKSFAPCYSQSPILLCLEISFSLNSRNLLQFLQFSYCTLSRRKEENLK
jgi:hypothetical protein